MKKNSAGRGNNSVYIVYVLICLQWIFLCSACSFNQHTKIDYPKAEKGLLDLKVWNFEKNGPVDCAGLWKFKWLESDESFSSPSFDDTGWENIQVPGFWNTIKKNRYGYGWYRLRITGVSGNNIGLYLNYCLSAYRLYVNGQLLCSNGKPGETRSTTVPDRVPALALLPTASEYTIALHVANFHDAYGGVQSIPRIGLISDLYSEKENLERIDILTFGCIFMMILYHLILWAGRKKDKSTLYFAACCFIILLRMFLINNYFPQIFPAINVFTIKIQLEYLTMTLSPFIFLAFFALLFQDIFKGKIYKTLLVINLIASLLVFLFPIWLVMEGLFIFQFILGMNLLYVIIQLIITRLRGHQDASILLIGMVILIVTAVCDIISVNSAIYTIRLIHFGLIGFIFSQSTILSNRFSKAFRLAEHLSVNLKEEVDRKTKEIEKQNRELIKHNEEKTNFFINFTHEIKTPLNNIYNYIYSYMKSHNHEDELIIKKNMEKLNRDIVNLMDIEKLKRGTVLYDHDQVVDFSAVLGNTVLLFDKTAVKRNITIHPQIDNDVRIKIDPYALDRVINNLMDNAIRYNRQNGKIEIRLFTKRETVQFSVSDNGIGIEERELSNIFKPYYQITHEKRNLQGIGIGLNIVKEIVESVSGSIDVKSTPDQGTTFTLTFPAATAITGKDSRLPATEVIVSALPLSAPDAQPGEEQYYDNRYTILIVEDNIETLVLLKKSLESLYNVFCAENGRIALNRIRNIPKPHIILSDIMMDEIDGYAFFDTLRRMDDFSDIPFIFITAKTTQKEKLEGLDRGAIHYIYKPFSVDEIIKKIESLLAFIQKKLGFEKNLIKAKVMNAFRETGGENNFSSYDSISFSDLTEREKEVVLLITRGYQNKEISRILNTSTRTIDKHIYNIYKKYNVQNRVELFNKIITPAHISEEHSVSYINPVGAAGESPFG
jgi:signal transduction histidine kinase/DNA-binding NarL/FixJ family response regulator